jgi:hypothetical protein
MKPWRFYARRKQLAELERERLRGQDIVPQDLTDLTAGL